jgi:1,4-alpha-glucan branching enzyme
MASAVTFLYHPGSAHPLFAAAELAGSWDAAGRPSSRWSTTPMTAVLDDAGCPAFSATVSFPDDVQGTTFQWGVTVTRPDGARCWGIPTEVCSTEDRRRIRSFVLGGGAQRQDYHLTYLRQLGANKHRVPGAAAEGIRFAVWAPHARAVELVLGDPRCGYIADEPDPARNGAGATSAPGQFPLTRDPATGIWSIDSGAHPALGPFAARDHGAPYMFKLVRDDGSVAYRTDLYSRCQIGQGKTDPGGRPHQGGPGTLDGTKGCSVVVDPERVMRDFDEPFPQQHWLSEDEFWASERNPRRPVPRRIEDLVIYELHVPGLGHGRAGPGTLGDAIALLDHLVELGVTAIELMPMAEYEGWASWGYGTSHFFAIEYVSGGRDQFKHFVRACHQRGLAVILDVVYNHYTPDAERAQWQYDSADPTRNIYYWYEGRPEDYPEFQRAVPPARRDEGGYVTNLSTGWAPRYWEEQVRQLFIGSAVALVDEFHVDGFRVDQTTSIHAYPALEADGRPVEAARAFGAKFLREWTRTLRLVKPELFLIAEDHSEWPAVVQRTEEGGLGFDAAWYANFYHHLIGDTGRGPQFANLLRAAAQSDRQPLALDHFGGALAHTGPTTVVYHESHDEAGNSRGEGWTSRRTIAAAVNGAPLVGETRRVAEARCRVAATLTVLSAGVPMFFMGEEVGFREPYRYDDFLEHREDFLERRHNGGSALFSFYRDLLATRAGEDVLRRGGIEVVYCHQADRVLAFRRIAAGAECLVVACLADRPFEHGYELVSDGLPDRAWKEILNSDAALYGGDNVGNLGATIASGGRRLRITLPAHGALVFRAT